MADIKEVPGAGTYQNIVELMGAMGSPVETTSDIMDQIMEMPLSVSVRSGWQQPGVTINHQRSTSFLWELGAGRQNIRRLEIRTTTERRTTRTRLVYSMGAPPWTKTRVLLNLQNISIMTKYFAYGSNLNMEQMASRTPFATQEAHVHRQLAACLSA